MLVIKKFEDRGAGLAAVFYDSFFDCEIVLNEANLRTRIANLNIIGHDTSVENAALTGMVCLCKIAKSKEG